MATVEAGGCRLSPGVLAALERKGGVALFITADHGNADKMLSRVGGAFTAHTTAPVPLARGCERSGRTLDGRLGALCDIAPTLLELIGLEAPAAMTGRSLLALYRALLMPLRDFEGAAW